MLILPTAAITIATTIASIFSGGMSEIWKPDHGQLQATRKAIYTFHSTGDTDAWQNRENGSTGT